MNWPTVLTLAVLHVGAFVALFMFNWRSFAVTAFLLWMATGLGISMGYHRLHTHRSYKVPRWLEYLFAVCGALTLEGGPIFWVATHGIHLCMAEQLSLAPHRCSRRGVVPAGRASHAPVGRLPSRGDRSAWHMAGELGDSHVGLAPFLDRGRFP